jgi:hypothetical protein
VKFLPSLLVSTSLLFLFRLKHCLCIALYEMSMLNTHMSEIFMYSYTMRFRDAIPGNFYRCQKPLGFRGTQPGCMGGPCGLSPSLTIADSDSAKFVKYSSCRTTRFVALTEVAGESPSLWDFSKIILSLLMYRKGNNRRLMLFYSCKLQCD